MVPKKYRQMFNCIWKTNGSRREIGSKICYGTDEKCEQMYLFKFILKKYNTRIFFLKQESNTKKLRSDLSEN